MISNINNVFQNIKFTRIEKPLPDSPKIAAATLSVIFGAGITRVGAVVVAWKVAMATLAIKLKAALAPVFSII